MASPSVTYTFSNSTTADATQVNTNFTDLINGITDGTKDLSINALTCAGTATLNGNVNIGNASGDDLTITASLASSVAVKTTATYNIGGSTTGLLSVYIAGTSSFTTRIISGATATWTLTLPPTTGVVNDVMLNAASGVTNWAQRHARSVLTKTGTYTILATDELILCSTSGGAFALTLPAASSAPGKSFKIQKTDSSSNALTISRAGSDTINGATSITLTVQYESTELISDGTSAWAIF